MTNLTRRNFILGSLGAAGLLSVGGLSGCSGSVAWYQLDKFISQDPSAIVKELEENQGLDYEGEQDTGTTSSYNSYLWVGNPKDPLLDNGEIEAIQFQKGEDRASMSRDELLNGEKITGAQILVMTDAFNNGSVQSTVGDIIDKCGFTNKDVEGMHEDGLIYIADGACKLNGQDARWNINVWEAGSATISVFLNDDADYVDNIKSHIEQQSNSKNN